MALAKREDIVATLHGGKAIPDIMKELRVSRATITIFNTKSFKRSSDRQSKTRKWKKTNCRHLPAGQHPEVPDQEEPCSVHARNG